MEPGLFIAFSGVFLVLIVSFVSLFFLRRSLRKDYERRGLKWEGFFPPPKS